MPVPTLAAAAPKGAPALALAEKAGEDLLSLPEQAEALTRELFQWLRTDSLGLLGGALLGAALYALLVVIRSWARGRLSRQAIFGSWSWVALKVVAQTRSFFLMMSAAEIVTALFEAPRSWAALIGFLFTVAAAVQGAFWVREFLIALVERKASGSADDAGMSSAVGVLTVIINVAVWAIAGIILLDNLGVNVTALVAGLGVGGIAIGLAAQGIFSDLFAALSILLDRPFKRGDTIQIGGAQGVVGTVEHIGLKTTRFRALSGELVVLSNANLLNQQINNFADVGHRRVVLLVEVIYQTDPALLEQIPLELQGIVNAVPACRFDRAHLFQFATSALNYELVFNVEHAGLQEMFDARQAVMLAIIRRFGELRIDFAFPTQTSLLAGPDGRVVPPHPEAGRGGRPAHLAGKSRADGPQG
jgi:small-conductance mechanosensitive channel